MLDLPANALYFAWLCPQEFSVNNMNISRGRQEKAEPEKIKGAILKRVSGYKALSKPLKGSVVTIGNFDGLHLGHKALLRKVIACADTLDLFSVVFTFRPHPLKILLPAKAPALLTTYEQKLDLIENVGVDYVIEQPFDHAFANLSAESFVADALHQKLHARVIYTGPDFKFGQGGRANTDTLRQLGAPFGMEIRVLDAKTFEGIIASSTQVRKLLHEGQVAAVKTFLGRTFSLTGLVVHGEARGRTIGFPTANLDAEQERIPAFGVYACTVTFDGEEYQAVTNVGVRPTFQMGQTTIEAHLLDFSGDLYDKKISLFFHQRLRGERSFSSLEELKHQVSKDCQQARDVLQKASSHG